MDDLTPQEVIKEISTFVDFAAYLGVPLMPWQIQFLQEMFAVGPDGQFRYRTVLIPRRRW